MKLLVPLLCVALVVGTIVVALMSHPPNAWQAVVGGKAYTIAANGGVYDGDRSIDGQEKIAALAAPRTALPRADFTHAFPDASRRPPLQVLLNDAVSDDANERLRAVMFLGFYRSERAFQALLAALQDKDMLIRLRALEGLRMQQDTRAIPAIEALKKTEKEGMVQLKAENVIEQILYPFGPPAGTPTSDEKWGGS
ncbi:MAG: HEAT repeat domain-containing protein [Acidobacteriota bacterium]